MKLRIDAKPAKDYTVEHPWFAWHPVRATDRPSGLRYWVWLAYVYRTGEHIEDSLGGGWSWTYSIPMCWYP